MIGYPLSLVACLILAASVGEAVICYHCYESFQSPVSSPSYFNGTDSGEKFVRCDKNINKWNSWECPAKWPVCILMLGKVQYHDEVIRTCGEQDFCSNYKPPAGVELKYCGECKTNFCNDYRSVPDPPVEPGPLYTFNVNINLNVKKYPAVREEEAAEDVP